MSDNVKVVMDEIQEAMAIARAGPWDGVDTPRQTVAYLQDDIQEAAAVMRAGAWCACDSQGQIVGCPTMESSREVAVALPSPSPAEDEREYDFMNVRPDIIVSVMEKNEWNMLDVVDPISGPIVKALTSSLFYPQSHLVPSPPDVVLKSSDAVLFYVHESVLNGASSNAFGALVNAGHSGGIKAVDENRDVLSVILRAQYDIISAAAYDPSLSTLVTAVDRFPLYGLSPSAFVTPTSAIYSLLSAYAPTHPAEVYMLAAHHGLEELAVLASAHLASFPLEQSTDETTKPMGEAYMARLVLSISVEN